MNTNLKPWNPCFRRVAIGFVAGSLAMAALSPKAGAQVTAEHTAARNKATVETSFDAWSAGTGSPFDLLAGDASWTIEGNSAASRTYPSKSAFLGEVIRPFNARMSAGIKPSVRSITAEENRVVILFDARGTARDGKPYANSYAWFFEMQRGRVVKASAFFDAIAFNDLWARVTPAAD